MQAVHTKYLCPTNFRGSRIKATCAAGSVTIGFPYDMLGQSAHRVAAELLVKKLRWKGELLGGCLPNGDYCFVFNTDLSKE